nr:ATP-binding cassette domain-containing protein [Paenibacillus thalictri]
MLKLQQLTKILPQGERPILFANVSAQIDEPQSIALLGASGQGKSTLLRMMAMLDVPDEGELHLHGTPASAWVPKEWRMQACYVAQQPVMLPGTVEDNLKAASRLHKHSFDQELARELMGELGLSGMDWGKRAGDLSGGEKQRVALIRSLLLRAPLYLLDETTSSLDAHSKRAVQRLLTAWQAKESCTMIWVTHDLDEARAVSQRIWFMADRVLCEDAETNEFFEQPATEKARRFLQAAGRH